MASKVPTMLSVEHARSLMLAGAPAGVSAPPRVEELVSVGEIDPGRGARILAAPLRARWPLPSADLSVMDGVALRSSELLGADTCTLALSSGQSAAGHPSEARLEAGTAIPISTGAVLPAGADMVVPIEDCDFEAEPGRVVISADACGRARSGRFVRAKGSELAADELLLDAGDALGPPELALVAAAGHAEVPVFARPRVTLISTGDELVAPGETPGPGQVIATNGLMLRHQVHRAGARVAQELRARDSLDATREALKSASARADLVITVGGISVGPHDHVWPALEALEAQAVFRKVRLRPGKPTSFAWLGSTGVLCLPGNPASAFVTFELFARPWLEQRAGRRPRGLPRLRLPLAQPVEAERTRDHYIRARFEAGRAHPLPTQQSGALRSIAEADLLLCVPAGAGRLAAGAEVDALRLPGGAA